MKKFTVLVALALLAATGTGYAVTCAQDNVPAATLLIPYFKVGRNGVTSVSSDIPEGGIDTMVAMTNVSTINLIAHVTVWNKYSAAVLDFNIPMTGYDVVTFRMKDILNGKLNPNLLTQDPTYFAGFNDVCFDTHTRPNDWPFTSAFVRFHNPDPTDYANAISSYSTPAFTGSFRSRVWDSLDESLDYTSMTSSSSFRDVDNPACSISSDGVIAGDFSGYLTIDVVNFCTNLFPTASTYYTRDAIATNGWGNVGGPNVLFGDVFFIDPAAAGGNISGDPAVAVEFDSRLIWWNPATLAGSKTFYGRYFTASDATATAPYGFIGDGREPLGNSYGFRYMNDAANGLQSWATVWRSDMYAYVDSTSTTVLTPNLCRWLQNRDTDLSHTTFAQVPIIASLFDEDENSYTASTGGPSGGGTVSSSVYVYLEAERLKFASNTTLNPAGYKFGWTAWTFPSVLGANYDYKQAFVGIEHTAPGAFVSVGYSAALLTNQFTCTTGNPFPVAGNVTQ